MQPTFYARYRFPPDIIRRAVWLYLRFTLSYRDVEDLLPERGLTVSNESVRRWVLKFGPSVRFTHRALNGSDARYPPLTAQRSGDPTNALR
jgi:putative transposase